MDALRKLEMQISVYKNGVSSIISHCICHSLIEDPLFDVEAYLKMVRLSFIREVGMTRLVERRMVREVIKIGRDQGLMEYVTGLEVPAIDGAAQIDPTHNPVLIGSAIRLKALLEQYITVEVK